MKLVVATRNRHKLEEIRQILQVPGLVLLNAQDYPQGPEVVEDQDTFAANAIKKAVMWSRHTGLWAMADDSGLEVDALGGEPGVRSARYAGEPSDDARNNAKLLRQLAGQEHRQARFRCVIALSSPRLEVRCVEGRCEGSIIEEERGRGGFGYDPVFVPDGERITFAEMDAEGKNRISHRGLALRSARLQWSGLLDGPH